MNAARRTAETIVHGRRVTLESLTRSAEVAMRRGFQRRESAVVAAIIAVLISLLLPAVQKMRDAAARTTCANNLKQFAIAAHNHADAFSEHFPPGTMSGTTLLPDQRLSFHVVILPWVECDTLYYSLAKSEAWDSPQNIGVLAQRTYTRYQCQSWVGTQGTESRLAATGYLAVTNYVGVAGVGADAAMRSADAPGNGIFGYDRTTALKDVKDGLANTLLLVETSHDLVPWIRGGSGTVRAIDPEDTPLAGKNRPFGGTHHGFNVLLADASVRLTTNDIDTAVFVALVTVSGGEELPASW